MDDTTNIVQLALEAFLQTQTLEDAEAIIDQYPNLLTDEIDLFLGSVISDARKKGQEEMAMALDERLEFLRSVRQDTEESQSCNLN